MPANNLTLKTAATSLTVVAGTDQVYTETGVQVPGGVNVSNAAQVDFRVRENITFKSREPKKASDGTWSKAKRSVTLLLPMLLASGDTVFNLVRMDMELHPETLAAEVLEARMLAGQILSTTSLANFFSSGSLGS